MKKNYTFFFMHRYLFDAYWSLPIINYLSKSNNINLFFFYKNGFENFKKLLPKKNVKIHNISEKNLIYDFYQKFKRIIYKFNFIDYNFLNFRVKTLIKSADIIYLPYVRNQKYLDQKRSDIYKYCKILNKSIYLFPPVSSNILFDLPRNLNVKKIFVITKNQKLFLKKKKINSDVVGSINFNPTHIKENILKFKNKTQPKKKKFILLILKNENANIFEFINYDNLTLYTLKELSKLKLRIIIKPHPQQNIEKLKLLIEQSKLIDYKIVNKPIFYLSSKAFRVITQYSGGILDIVSTGKIPFLLWPVKKFIKKNKKIISPAVLKKVIGIKLSDVTQYKDFSIKINKVEDLNKNKHKTYQKKFKFKQRYIKRIDYKVFY